MLNDEKLIEAVARALCTAVDLDPDQEISWDPPHGGWSECGPRWKSRVDDARKQIAAFEVIERFLQR